jgi:hypothetical protein
MTGFLLSVSKFQSLLWQNHLHNTGLRHTSFWRQETKSVHNRYTQNKTKLCILFLCKLKCGSSLCIHLCWYYVFRYRICTHWLC